MSEEIGLQDGQRGTLRAIVGHIIPASADLGVPGADDDLIFADILRSARRDDAALRQAIATVEAAAAGGFLELTRQEQLQLLARFREAHPDLARVCEVVTARCYYRDDRVMRSIGMSVRPPFPLGFEVEQGDWDLLAPVRQRGKIYRDPV